MIARNAGFGVLLAVLGCGGTSPTKTPTAGVPEDGVNGPVAAEAVVPATVSAQVRGGDGTATLSAVITVEVAGASHELTLTSSFDDCESSEAPVEKVEALKDDRLRMIQLFCESGEDFFSREMITALVLVGVEKPRVLWEGVGSYSSEMGECESISVLFFRPGADGTIEAVRSKESTASEENPECKAEAATETVEATLEIPPGS